MIDHMATIKEKIVGTRRNPFPPPYEDLYLPMSTTSFLTGVGYTTIRSLVKRRLISSVKYPFSPLLVRVEDVLRWKSKKNS